VKTGDLGGPPLFFSRLR